MNPEAGHEAEPPPPPVDPPKRVVVAGGGPAGLECARRLAERGHAVELWEAGDRLGGRLALAEQADADLAGLLAWLIGGAEDAGVHIRLGTPVTGEIQADVLVWAVGSRWPGGGGVGVDDLRSWLDRASSLVDPVEVHGSGKAALSIALRARRDGHDVTLVPDDPVLAPELGLPGRFRLVAAAHAAGVVVSAKCGPTPATTVDVGGAPAAPPPPHPEVHVIGDAEDAGPGGLAAAFAAAARVAAAI